VIAHWAGRSMCGRWSEGACCEQVWSVPERETWPRDGCCQGHQLVLFGEQTTMDFSDELWTFDLPAAAWTLLTGAASGASDQRVSARSANAMLAFVSPRVLLFGIPKPWVRRTSSGPSSPVIHSQQTVPGDGRC